MANMQNGYIENIFVYHPPKEGQPEKYERIRASVKNIAYIFNAECPECEEFYEAIKKLREAVSWANAAIAINE